jgi:peptide/nickel transport system substrate-binding protein/oligopeptide transport system substrate-binding protein
MPLLARSFRQAAGFLAAAVIVLAPVAAFAAKEEPVELVMAASRKTVTLDPLHTFTAFESQLFTALYEGLLSADPVTLAPRPGIASSWTVSDDGRTYRFTLRPDSGYSNGDRVKAKDFVDSWLRMIDPAAKAEYSFLFDVIKGAHAWRTGTLTDRKQLGFRAVSDRVLEVELERPAAHFLVLLTHIAFVPVHPSLVAARGPWDDARTLVSDGPFHLVSRTADEMVLEKNLRYWDARNVGLDRVRVRFYDDAAAATEDYLAGRVHWSTIGDFELVSDPNQFEAFPMFSTSYFFFACDASPWSDARVRRALALLVAWDEVRGEDLIFPTSRLVPSIEGYPEVKGIEERDAAKARELLAEAGFPGGRGLPKLPIRVFGGSSAAEAARAMAATWNLELGLETEVRESEGEEYFAGIRSRGFGLAVSTWIGDYADPLTFLQLWTTGSNLNDAGFSDPAFDAAVEEAVGIRDPKQRYRKLADAERMLLDSAAVLPLNHSAVAHLINLNRIDGWHANALDLHPFKFIRFKEQRAPSDVALLPAR